MSQVYRVGRDRENDIVLDDATVSRTHAELRLEGNGDVLLVDLNSTNGTCVRDGNKWIEIERATVDADERILIGDVVTTVDALIARRAALGVAEDDAAAGENRRRSAALPAPANDAGLAAPETMPHPLASAAMENSHRPLSQRIASDFARLVFRPGRRPSGSEPRLAADRASDEPAPASVRASRPAADEASRRSPSFRYDAPDSRVESPSLIARRIGEQIGKRERLPSIQVEANPARRIDPSRTQPRRWLKPAVLSTAASMALVAAIAAVAIHGPGSDRAGPAGGNTTLSGGTPPTAARKDGTTRVAGRAAGALPPGMLSFGGPKIDSFRAVTAMKDGGYLAVGSTESGSAGGFDMWIVRTGPSGTVIWEKRFGGTGDDYGLSVVATADGGAVVAGAADSRRFVWILRIDDKGEVRWSRRIEAGYRGHATAVVAAREGFVVSAVVEAKKGDPVTGTVFRLDEDGGTLWRRNFGPTYTWISSVQATYGAFVVAGVAKPAGALMGSNALWVAKVDLTGKTIWSKRLPLGEGRDAEAFARMARQGDIIVATTHQAVAPGGLWPTRHARLLRLNKDGDVTWRYLHKGEGRERVGGMVLVRGGMVLAGTAAPSGAGSKPAASDIWIAKIDTNSKTEWERRYGSAGADGASGFAQVGHRGFVLVGTTDAGPGRGRDGLLVAVDNSGRIVRRAVAKKD